jgi:hypothetical protein
MSEEASVQTICPTVAAVAVADAGEAEGEGVGESLSLAGVVPTPVCERGVQATSVPARTSTTRRATRRLLT